QNNTADRDERFVTVACQDPSNTRFASRGMRLISPARERRSSIATLASNPSQDSVYIRRVLTFGSVTIRRARQPWLGCMRRRAGMLSLLRAPVAEGGG